LGGLHSARDLVGLELRNAELEEAAWEQISGLDLLWLTIESSGDVFNGGTPQLGRFSRLCTLTLIGMGITDSTISRVNGIDSVRALSLEHTAITDSGVTELPGLRRLWYVNLGNTRIEGTTLQSLSDLHELAEIVLDQTACGDVAMKGLTSVNSLQSVSLNWTQITDEGVCQLAELPNLRTVSLVATETSDASLSLLAHNQSMLTAVDRNGDVVVFKREWAEHGAGRFLPTEHAPKGVERVFLWTNGGRQLLYQKEGKSKGEQTGTGTNPPVE
jgi:hypothetical protein